MKPKRYADFTEYQAELSAFLKSFRFDTFGTFTTKKTLTIPAARKLAEKFHSDHPEITMFFASEPFDTREGYHFHALINSRNDSNLLHYTPHDYWNYWTNTRGLGRSQFLEVSHAFGKDYVEQYVVKYVSKELADYDLFTPKEMETPISWNNLSASPKFVSHDNLHRFQTDTNPTWLSRTRQQELQRITEKTRKGLDNSQGKRTLFQNGKDSQMEIWKIPAKRRKNSP